MVELRNNNEWEGMECAWTVQLVPFWFWGGGHDNAICSKSIRDKVVTLHKHIILVTNNDPRTVTTAECNIRKVKGIESMLPYSGATLARVPVPVVTKRSIRYLASPTNVKTTRQKKMVESIFEFI